MDQTQQEREGKKSRRREIRKRRKANILYLHATTKLKMKISKVPPPGSHEDLTSDLSNLKNENKVNSNIGINSTDKFKNLDTKNKDQVPSRNDDTNTHDNTNYDTASAKTNTHNSNDSILNSAELSAKVDEVENCEIIRNIHLNSDTDNVKTTVTLLGQNVECLKSADDYIRNTYKDNSDLSNLKPSSLTVENINARRNGNCNLTFEDPYRDSSSSCSSPNHAQAELEDDSAHMVLRISEDENMSSASSPVPTSSVNTSLDKSDQVDGDSCKEKPDNLSPVPDVNNTFTESITKTNSFNKVENIKNTAISADNKELSTDKCSENSDDNFDDLIGSMSSKEIELTKNKNHGVTVSDLRKEIEDFLNTGNSVSSEVIEKSFQNTDVSAKIITKSVNNANCYLKNINDKNSSDENNKKVLQTSDTVTKVLGSTDQIRDECEENKESDIEEASGSTIDSGLSKDIDPTASDADDEKCPTEIDSEKDSEFSSNEMNVSSNEWDVLPLFGENTPELNVDQSSQIAEPEKLMETDELDSSEKQGNSGQTTSETEESDESIKIYTISSATVNEPSDSNRQIITDTDVDSELKSNGDKLNNCAVVNDTKSDEVKDGDSAEGLKLRFSLKRSLEKNNDKVDSKKMKVLETRLENEQKIPNNESPLEKMEPLPDVQKKIKVSDSKYSAKRLLDKQIDEVAKRLKMEFNSIKPGLRKASGSKIETLKELMIRRGLQKLSKKGLEEYVLQKISEAINHTTRLAEMAEEIKMKDIALETMRTKFLSISKQVTDLDIVQSRISSEMRKVNDPREVVPVKITRSVGLQVSLQPLKAKTTIPVPPSTPEPLPAIAAGTPAKKKTQRTSAAGNRAVMLPPPPPALTPAPSHIRPPQVPTGKGIKTILPKVSSSAEARDGSNSLLGNILQKSPLNSSPTASSSPRKSTGDTVKVIDLTDEDDSNRASSNNTPSTSGNIRVVASHQLTNTTQDPIQPIVTTNMPRLTYLVQTPGQQGQQVLLATTSAPTKPGQARPTLMFKPVVPQGTQKLNLVRPANHVSNAVAVLPTSLSAPGVCKYVTTAYTPGPLTRSPTQTTRAIAPAPRHPAPLPGPPSVQASQPSWKLMPPKPSLKITLVGDGIVLSWRILNKDMSLYEDIASYQLYAYQETSAPPSTEMWRKVGDVRALALPMACTLTQFTDGNKYHFAVRGVDVKSRVGPFSTPEQITLPAQQ